jgi:hypothetical protein
MLKSDVNIRSTVFLTTQEHKSSSHFFAVVSSTFTVPVHWWYILFRIKVLEIRLPVLYLKMKSHKVVVPAFKFTTVLLLFVCSSITI